MLVIWMKKIGRCSIGLIRIAVVVIIGRRVRMNLKGIVKGWRIKIIEDIIKKGKWMDKAKVMKSMEKGRFMIKM